MIELGAGFDFDLTAGENIFLNGALMGRSHEEMEAHYEEIIEFSELRDFTMFRLKISLLVWFQDWHLRLQQ